MKPESVLGIPDLEDGVCVSRRLFYFLHGSPAPSPVLFGQPPPPPPTGPSVAASHHGFLQNPNPFKSPFCCVRFYFS
ncbi:hypothetical protein SAY86_004636 [Trapa natans]|uniref:Uncharacterized protein n=1 Tax=Trapa natans TaxID=22666 RepID=A0AAN7MFX3_TRANT|nr:hypothetical protein SAY86_004636 [Trapa natans]